MVFGEYRFDVMSVLLLTKAISVQLRGRGTSYSALLAPKGLLNDAMTWPYHQVSE